MYQFATKWQNYVPLAYILTYILILTWYDVLCTLNVRTLRDSPAELFGSGTEQENCRGKVPL